MTTAIIRHKTSGESFLADLDDEGTAVRLSAALPITDAQDPDTGEVDWERFADADMEPWEDDSDRWEAETFVVVHAF